MTDFRDWLTDADDPVAQQDAEARRLIPDADPGALHSAGQTAGEALEIAQELFSRGIPMREIPIEDIDRLRQMLQETERSPEAAISADLNDLGDGMDQFSNDARARGVDPADAMADLEQFDQELHLAGKMQVKPLSMLKPTPARVWAKGVDSIPGPPLGKKKTKRTRRAQLEEAGVPPDEELPSADGEDEVPAEPEEETIEDLLGRLESTVDAMGDSDVDPTLAAAATIIARRLLSRLGEMTMQSAGVPAEEPEPSLDEELAEVGEPKMASTRIAQKTCDKCLAILPWHAKLCPNCGGCEDCCDCETMPKLDDPFVKVPARRKPREHHRHLVAARLIRVADRLDALEIPVIPDLVDECLIRIANRDYETYDPDFPKKPWTPHWKHSEGPLENPRRKPVGIDSAGGGHAYHQRKEQAYHKAKDTKAMVKQFADPETSLDSFPATTLEAIRSMDRKSQAKVSSDLAAQIIRRKPEDMVQNAIAKLKAIGDPMGALELAGSFLGRDLVMADSNSDNVREAAGFYRQPDDVADPFEAHRIRRHVRGEEHTIPTELKDRILARGLATEDEFEQVGPDQWRHLNTKYENHLRNVGDTMQNLFRMIDEPRQASNSAEIRTARNPRARLQELIDERKRRPNKKTQQPADEEPILEKLKTHRRLDPHSTFTGPAKILSNTRSAQVDGRLDEVSQKLVDMLLNSGGLQSLGVAKKLDVSQSTAKRILNKLSQAGIVVQDAMATYRRDGTGGRTVFWRLSDQFKANYIPPVEDSSNPPIEQSSGQINPTTGQELEYSNSPSLEQSSDQLLEQSIEPMGGEITGDFGGGLAAAASRAAGVRRVRFSQVVQRMTSQQCQICGGQITEDSVTGEMACQDCGMPAEVLPENMTNQEAGEFEDFTPEMEDDFNQTEV